MPYYSKLEICVYNLHIMQEQEPTNTQQCIIVVPPHGIQGDYLSNTVLERV